MSAPLSFAWRNVLFARDLYDAWGLYRLQATSYAGLSTRGKVELLSQVAAFACAVEADFQLLRVTRSWSGEQYARDARSLADPEHGQHAELDALLGSHRLALAARSPLRPEVFLAVRLRDDDRSGGWFAGARRAVGLTEARAITRRQLDEVLDRERRAFGRLGEFLDADRASTAELQWLIRRASTRGVGEPWSDELWRPQALILDASDEDGGHRFIPAQADLLRLLDDPMTVTRDHVQVGDSHQVVLVAGALPETTSFPGSQAELLFAPLEAVGFAVDACFSARWLGNQAALSLVRRRIVDADHAYSEESHGDHGPTARTSARPDLVRELEEQLTASDRPPLLRAQLSLAVGASTVEELDDRVRSLRREYAPVALHRPKDVQQALWASHLPGQLAPLRRYDDVMLPEQLGAMVPTATHAVGADTGLLIGTTLSGSQQPVLFDVTEGSRTSRPPAVLITGTLGSGKTMTAELLAFHAFLGGSRVIDLDPKGDHHLADVIGRQHVEQVELTAGGADRGLLDPLRIAPPDLRVELAHSFLTELLPAPVPAQWQTEIRASVTHVADNGGRSCALVLDHLQGVGGDAAAAARALDVHARSGLLQLGFADSDSDLPVAGERPVISLRIANLTLPVPGTPKTDLTEEERTGRALLRLLAVQALHLATSDPGRHAVLVIEELSQLVGDAVGLGLIGRIVRLCRSQNATPILVTQVVEDVAAVSDLAGALMCFGVESDREAGRVLGLLGLDEHDRALAARLRSFRRGRCLMRDYQGRVAPVQIDLFDPELLARLDTTPGARHAQPAHP